MPRGTERPRASDDFWYPAVSRRREAGLLWKAFGIALVLHLVALLISFPEFRKEAVPAKEHRYVIVRKYIPPPPKIQHRRTVQKKKLTRKLPIPDPTPDDPEPIREPEPELELPPLPDDVEYLLGVPEAPPAVAAGTGPLIAGTGNITNPVRIEESCVKPHYPDLARIARIQGTVILQAVIHRDGSVGEITVLRCSDPGFGFEEEAQKAVSQWRYEPATQDGSPVDVFFTVVVEFTLA